MSRNSIFKVAILAGALLGTVSAQSSSAEPSLYTGQTPSNSTSTISTDPASATPSQNSTSTSCASCSFPPRSIRTVPLPALLSTTSEASVTSTVFTTVTYTITSCRAEVTNFGIPALSLPVGPTGTEHLIYSSFVIPPGASPIATHDASHGTATNAGVVVTPQPSSAPTNEATEVIEPSKAAIPKGNSTIESSHMPMPAILTAVPDLTSKIADSNVVTKTADGVVASTGSATTCAGPTCTEWISAASKRSSFGFLGGW
ncbi:hypothetical protein BKA61DRAFT_678944 [Leptodontidium sp. MPI-SDFR-AT-0119]|nr:hypothetical protein BKA61DRAFT_678944 [Leptodontidium sp. MPI-SDFR-AT-0119]